ncbi:MAG: adenosylmethionine decarboxylase [bacterium]|nr:adenosylmethionine decarboxylase [bacterium]
MMETKVNSAVGTHIITELSGCNTAKLGDLDGVRAALLEAAQRAQAHVLDISLHRFQPQGVSGVAVIAESHISVHTWPELGYAALDIYTCGETALPEKGCAYLSEFFEAGQVCSSVIKRGLASASGLYSHEFTSHDTEIRV